MCRSLVFSTCTKRISAVSSVPSARHHHGYVVVLLVTVVVSLLVRHFRQVRNRLGRELLVEVRREHVNLGYAPRIEQPITPPVCSLLLPSSFAPGDEAGEELWHRLAFVDQYLEAKVHEVVVEVVARLKALQVTGVKRHLPPPEEG